MPVLSMPRGGPHPPCCRRANDSDSDGSDWSLSPGCTGAAVHAGGGGGGRARCRCHNFLWFLFFAVSSRLGGANKEQARCGATPTLTPLVCSPALPIRVQEFASEDEEDRWLAFEVPPELQAGRLAAREALRSSREAPQPRSRFLLARSHPHAMRHPGTHAC